MLVEEPDSPGLLASIQSEAWEKTYRHACAHSPFYRERFRKAGLSPDRPPRFEEFDAIPRFDKQELSQLGSDLLCVPRDRIVEIVTTSGTSGRPFVSMLTEPDLARLAHNEYLCLKAVGLGPSDTVLLGVTMDRCFIAGLAYHSGLRRLGCGIVRVGAGVPAMVRDMIERVSPTALIAVPSFLKHLSEQPDFDPGKSGVRKLVCIGEPIRESSFELNRLGKQVEASWGARLYSTYGNTELACSLCECDAGRGGHVLPGILHVEILDEQGKAVKDGEAGELVATTLGVEGMPMIRYRTGDITTLHRDPCSCGRVTPRVGPIVGRLDQKLKVKGTTLYPSAIQAVLAETGGIDAYVIIATSSADLSDSIEVRLSCREQVIPKLESAFQGRIKVVPRITPSSPAEIESLQMKEGTRKRRFFVDRR